MVKDRLIKMGLLSLVVLSLSLIDQWLKQVGTLASQIGKHWGPINFVWYENPGIAFSINLPSPIAIGLVIILLIILIRLFWLYRGGFGLYLIGLLLVISGGFSNLIDKLRFGFVRDFVAIGWLPIFNFADIMIFIGLIMIIINISYGGRKQKV